MVAREGIEPPTPASSEHGVYFCAGGFTGTQTTTKCWTFAGLSAANNEVFERK